jgi:hydroxyacylglutathione hydrolase
MSVKASLQVTAIPAFADNYLWLIHDGHHAVVVDPGDAAPVEKALSSGQLTLAAIVLTHHHGDHAGGVAELLRERDIPVYGPANEKIAGVTHRVSEGDTLLLTTPTITFSVLDVPGHTAGHVAYVDHQHGWLFCGDTLFAGGCGRLFEGTAEQMTQSLAKLSALPDTMKVYCAHEYTCNSRKQHVSAASARCPPPWAKKRKRILFYAIVSPAS